MIATDETCEVGLRHRCGAGIVAFNPDPDQLVQLVGTIEGSVQWIFIFLNSEIGSSLRSCLKARPNVTLIDAEENLGIGVGLNMIVLAAMLCDCEFIILFDQDSRPTPTMIAQLEAVFRTLTAQGQNPAVVAPRMVAPDGLSDSKAPSYRLDRRATPHDGARAVQFVPTSGSLIPLDVFRRIGLFRADYFIDGIDLEWSFRAWARGFSCWMIPDCPMPHTVGSGTIALPLIGRSMPNQHPFRMYCALRNAIYGFRLRHIPIRWKLAQLAYLPLQALAYAAHHRFRADVVRQLLAAVLDGLKGRLGVPRTAPNGRSVLTQGRGLP